jgi:hypothetical protein
MNMPNACKLCRAVGIQRSFVTHTHANFCFITAVAFSLYFACVPNNARAGINNNKVKRGVYVWYCAREVMDMRWRSPRLSELIPCKARLIPSLPPLLLFLLLAAPLAAAAGCCIAINPAPLFMFCVLLFRCAALLSFVPLI